MIGTPNSVAPRPAVAAPPGSNDSSEPTGASMTGSRSFMPRKFVVAVDVGDVAQHARAERDGVERRPVAPQRRLALGRADQVAPDVAVELRPRRRDEFVQALVVAGRSRSGAALRASISPPFGCRHQARQSGQTARGSHAAMRRRRSGERLAGPGFRHDQPDHRHRRKPDQSRGRGRPPARPLLSATQPAAVVLKVAPRPAARLSELMAKLRNPVRRVTSAAISGTISPNTVALIAVQHLHAPPAAWRPAAWRTAAARTGSAAKPSSRTGLRPMRLCESADPGREQCHHDLRHDDRRRHHKAGPRRRALPVHSVQAAAWQRSRD